MTNQCGIGAAIDQARQGMGCRVLTFSEVVPRETRRYPLAPGVPVRALVQGACCSIDEQGRVLPFDASRRFGGFVIKLFEDRDVQVAVDARGAVLLRVEGMTLDTKMGAPVYAVNDKQFSTEANGAVIGQLLAIESFEKSLAIVGFRRLDDVRPFEMGGRIMERGR